MTYFILGGLFVLLVEFLIIITYLYKTSGMPGLEDVET